MYNKISDVFKAYRVEQNETIDAEKRMGIAIPCDLRKFYQEVGYGFVKNETGAINRLIDPLGCPQTVLTNRSPPASLITI